MLINSQIGGTARQVTLCLALTAASFSNTAQADQCDDISQALTMMGDSYYSVDNPQTHTEREKLQQQMLLEKSPVFSQLRDADFKGGIGERTVCLGAGDDLRQKTSSVELRDISQRDRNYRNGSELEVDAHEYNETENRAQRESIYLSLSDNTDVLATGDGTTLKLNSRRRQATLEGSYLREIDLSAVLTDRGIDIKQKTYINGHLAEWFTWSLSTRR